MNKTVLITGASSGFGKLAAKNFQRAGWNVIGTMRNPSKEQELNQLDNVYLVAMDVRKRESVRAAIEKGIERFGRIDVLVNNAGFGMVGYIEEASDEEIDIQMETNFYGVVYNVQEVLPYMRKQGGGVIINITSLAGTVPIPFHSLYNASKFAVEGFSHSISYELEQFGIDVKTIAPGAFKTNFGNNAKLHKGNSKTDLKLFTERFEKRMEEIYAEPPKPFGYGDPQVVADLIFKSATEKTKNKLPVGKDAKLTLKMRKLLPESKMRKMFKDAFIPK
ncbi:SDR family oxidoreductase [Aureivirga marina]|uniref:SDR family oxidoreductase n=1 Tax=Aureivirga marina TaxID=1182451 RepID=UPI0018C97A3E|nr:SDR family oxidoreductase [Aureivirga marina]